MVRSLFSFESRRRRKTKVQKRKEKGRRAYRKGEQFEKKAYPFLSGKGLRVTKSRVRSRRREEFDALATDKQGRTYGVEVKGTKQKVSSGVIKSLKRKVDKQRLLRGGIVVSRSGFTEQALKEAKRAGIKTYKYKRKRRKRAGWFF